MSIFIRDCGHSAETASKAYQDKPEVCVSCKYLEEHPQTKKTVRNPWGRKGKQKPDPITVNDR